MCQHLPGATQDTQFVGYGFNMELLEMNQKG